MTEVEGGLPRVKPNPKAVGIASEAVVMARLIQLGFDVSIPFGDNARYDLVVDDGTRLTRVQIKTGRLLPGGIEFNPRSVSARSGERRGYQGQADDFLVYCPQTDEVYRVPVEDCAGTERVVLSINPEYAARKRTPVRWAHEHVFVTTARTDPLSTCATMHPDTPTRLAMKSLGGGERRRYCRECNRVTAKRERDRKKALRVASNGHETPSDQHAEVSGSAV